MSLIAVSVFVTLICQRWFRMSRVLPRSEWEDIGRAGPLVTSRTLSKEYGFTEDFPLDDVI